MTRTLGQWSVIALCVVLTLVSFPAPRLGVSAGPLDQSRRYYMRHSDAPPQNGAVTVTFLETTTLLFDDDRHDRRAALRAGHPRH